jgi:hypothetical protein
MIETLIRGLAAFITLALCLLPMFHVDLILNFGVVGFGVWIALILFFGSVLTRRDYV